MYIYIVYVVCVCVCVCVCVYTTYKADENNYHAKRIEGIRVQGHT
jgi:hypothetical protein